MYVLDASVLNPASPPQSCPPPQSCLPPGDCSASLRHHSRVQLQQLQPAGMYSPQQHSDPVTCHQLQVPLHPRGFQLQHRRQLQCHLLAQDLLKFGAVFRRDGRPDDAVCDCCSHHLHAVYHARALHGQVADSWSEFLTYYNTWLQSQCMLCPSSTWPSG